MLLIREIMYCKPGKVKPMLEKMRAMAKLNEQAGLGKVKLMTDFCAERYWTLVMEFEVESVHAFEEMMAGTGMTEEMGKKFEAAMAGYHDLVERGKREIYRIEG